MVITITGRHLDLTEAMKSHAQERVRRVLKYFDRINEIDVIFEQEHGTIRCEVIVQAEHSGEFVAQDHNPDAYAGVDAAVAKLERQIREHKQQLRNRKHPG